MMDVTEASKFMWNRGVHILQGHRLEKTDAGHMDALMQHMGLNGERYVADMGCGFGEVSRVLADKLNGSMFWLVNTNEFQLSKCPQKHWFDWCNEDMTDTSIPSGMMDLVMFNWSLCHVNVFSALKEAHRIANEKGHLFVYDLERTGGDNSLTMQYLNASFTRDDEFRSFAEDAGWRDVETLYPVTDDTLFRESFGDDALYEEVTRDLRPVIWKARK